MTAWLIEALVASALLMALVLLIRGSVRRMFGPGIAYALWALPALRLLLPPLPGWGAAVAPVRRATETVVLIVEPVRAGAAAPAVAAGAALGLGSMLVALWISGTVALLGWYVLDYHRLRRRLLTGATPIGEREGVRIIASAGAPGPIAFGILRRYVAFPADFTARYDVAERELALAHELGHHARGDLAANWAALTMLALHWCNPLAWRAFRAFRADQELANDARVLAGRDPAQRHAYACAIVKAAHGSALSAACHLHTIEDLKGRLRMLTTSRTSHRRVAAGGTMIAGLILAGLGLTASSSGAAAITGKVGETLGVELQAGRPAASPIPASAVPMPATAAMPAAPPVPARGSAKRRVVIVKDGKTTTYEGAAADAYVAAHPMPVPPPPPALPGHGWSGGEPGNPPQAPAAPEAPSVSLVDCPPGSASRFVVRDAPGGRQRIMVCTDRVDMAAMDAARVAEAVRIAADGERTGVGARADARINLALARTAIAVDRNLTDRQRRDALAGITRAQAELDAEID